MLVQQNLETCRRPERLRTLTTTSLLVFTPAAKIPAPVSVVMVKLRQTSKISRHIWPHTNRQLVRAMVPRSIRGFSSLACPALATSVLMTKCFCGNRGSWCVSTLTSTSTELGQSPLRFSNTVGRFFLRSFLSCAPLSFSCDLDLV